MVYEALNNLAPDNVKDLFKNVSDTHNRNTRSVDKALLHIIYQDFKLVHSKIRSQLWNTTPLEVRTSYNSQSKTIQWHTHLFLS